MQKYVSLFKNHFSTALEYRSNLVGIVLNETIGVGAMLILWLAIFQTNKNIGGFDVSQTIFYYLVLPLIGVVTSADLSNRLGNEIKDGFMSNYLLKPYKVAWMCLARVIGSKFSELAIIFPFYFLVIFIVCFKLGLDFSFLNLALGLFMAFLGFFFHFVLELSISWLAFYMDDVWSFEHFKKVIVSVLGGLAFPFEFLPQSMKFLFEILPFKFIYYVPASYSLGNRGLEHLAGDLLLLSFWILFFVVLAKVLYKKGLKLYEAYGN